MPEFWHPGKGLVFRSFCTDTDTNEIRTGKVNFWDCSIGSIQNAEVTYGVCDDVLEVLLIKVKKGDVDLMLDTLVSLYGQPNFVEDRFFEWYLDEDTVLLRFKFTGGIINRYGRAEAAWMRKESSSVQD